LKPYKRQKVKGAFGHYLEMKMFHLDALQLQIVFWSKKSKPMPI